MRIDGIYVLYRVIQYLGFPFILLYLLVRGLKDRRYFANIRERFGWLPFAGGRSSEAIWLHAVSVGEVLSSVELLRSLRARFPRAPLFVSSTTLAGRAIALRKLAGLADGVFYAPIDYCFAIRAVLRALKPRVVAIVETEIWPNLYRESKRAGCGLLIVNGRISDRAAPRYAARRWFFRHVLQWPDRILAQSEISRRRYIDAGAPPDKVTVAGNLKYDFDPTQARPADAVQGLIDRCGGKRGKRGQTHFSELRKMRLSPFSPFSPFSVWVAASTMPPAHPQDVDEDDVVLAAFRKLAADHPGLLLLLAPRKPERFDVVAQKLDAAGVRYLRRSALADESTLELPGVLLVDSMGELSGLFALADVVFMGGTLAERGGHNILEPAFFARPIIVGPHMENFPDIAAEYSAARAYVEIGAAAELPQAVENLLTSPQQREELGQRARQLAEAKRGATQAAVDAIASLREESSCDLRATWRNLCASWLSTVWAAASKWQRTHTTARRLATPVISVGGIAMGGVGKTPFVAWLVGRLKAGGLCPAVLTRGYRRRSRQIALLAPGTWAPTRLTGDEPQVLLRSGIGPVGIGRNRFEVGRRMQERFQCGVFILDDGFQHWRLARDLDIVLLDALDPFGGGGVFPAGRLREPPEALARADAIVITRAEREKPYEEIVSLVRRHNDHAPIFTSRVVPGPWMDPDGWGAYEYDAPFSRAAAFCGLANPGAFWQTLESLGIRPVPRWTFRDHHRYNGWDLGRMATEARDAGADALVTTQKDAVNLPRDWRERAAPLNIHVLRIDLEVDNEEALLSLIRRRI